MVTDIRKQFTIFYETYYPVVYRYVRGRKFPYNHLQDLVSKVFELAWHRFGEYSENPHKQFWVLRIAENCCNYEKRKFWKDKTLQFAELDFIDEKSVTCEDLHESSREDFIKKQNWQIFTEHLLKLPKKQREIVQLRLEGFSYKTMSKSLGISAEACRRRMERAIDFIQKAFQKKKLKNI